MLQVPGDVAFSALFSVMILIFYCRTWMAALVKCRNFSCPSFPDVRNIHYKVVPKRIANTIHFRAANETKLHIKSLIPNHFLLYWKKEMNFLVSVRYTSIKTIIHLRVGKIGGHLPCHFMARWIYITIHLPIVNSC